MDNIQKQTAKFDKLFDIVLDHVRHANDKREPKDNLLTIETDGNSSLTLRSTSWLGKLVGERRVTIDENTTFDITNEHKSLHVVSSATQASKLVFIGING